MEFKTEVKEKKSAETIEKEGNADKIKRYMNNVEERVKKICNESENASDNDLWLCLSYWKVTGEGKVSEFSEYGEDFVSVTFKIDRIDKITKPETISRARRKLRKEGKIGYSEETEEIRERGSREYKEYYSNEKNTDDFDRKSDEWVF